MDRTFLDIHMHAMDLSHPNLLAFINRIKWLGSELVLGGLAEPFLHEQEKKLANLLSRNRADRGRVEGAVLQ